MPSSDALVARLEQVLAAAPLGQWRRSRGDRDPPGRQEPGAADRRGRRWRGRSRRRRRRDPRGLRGPRRLRRDGCGAVHLGGRLSRRRPAADPAPALAAQRSTGWSRSPSPTGRRSPAGSPAATSSRPGSTCPGASGSWRWTTCARHGSRSSSSTRSEGSDGHRHEHPEDAGAGEGALLRRACRGDRAGVADGVPEVAGSGGAGSGHPGPQVRPRHRAGRRRRRGGRATQGSTTTLPRGSAGSPPRRRSRSCSSGCATPRTR